eukprot:11612057-Karenia_brevis.AAC.1
MCERAASPLLEDVASIGTPLEYEPATPDGEQMLDPYVVEFDGASRGNPGPAGAGALLMSPTGE